MTFVRLSRRFLKDALTKEARYLTPGSWISRRTGSRRCNVCAVGAVMSHVVARNDAHSVEWFVHDVASAADRAAGTDGRAIPSWNAPSDLLFEEALRIAESGAYMAALSHLFEGFRNDNSFFLQWRDNRAAYFAPAARKVVLAKLFELIDLFPPTIVVDIDGAAPAKDVPRARAAKTAKRPTKKGAR